MDLVSQYVDELSKLLSWLSSPDSTIPVVRLLQGIAAILGALISTLGFYKAWRYAERRLGHRLSEFLKHEEQNFKLARESIKQIRGGRSAIRPNQPKIFTNDELKTALRQVRRGRLKRAETLLVQSLARTEKKENLAREKADLHENQRAMAHLLLGAIEDRNGHHGAALIHFQAALEIDSHDAEAREYVGLQLLKLGNAAQALAEFTELATIAQNRGDQLLLAHAHRNRGIAFEALPVPQPGQANIAYNAAIAAFPKDGRPLEIAHIYELSGLVNIRLNFTKQAHESLMHALTRYSQLALIGNRDVGEAENGAQRIHDALDRMNQLQNDGQAATPPDDGLQDDPKLPALNGNGANGGQTAVARN